MLRQMSRRAHLTTMLDEVDSKDLANILNPVDIYTNGMPVPLTSIEVSKTLAKAPNLEDAEYASLLFYLHCTGRPYRSFKDLPHPPNAQILPPRALSLLQLHRGEHTFSCANSHQGNSAICFHNPLTNTPETGSIQKIWRLPLDGSMHTFMVVQAHKLLPPLEEERAPFSQHPRFMARIVDAKLSDNFIIIEPTHIITHLVTFKRPEGTYGIDRKSLIVCWALNRGRR